MHFFHIELHFGLQFLQSLALSIVAAGNVGADAFLGSSQQFMDRICLGLCL
jgi:hypothetical protein